MSQINRTTELIGPATHLDSNKERVAFHESYRRRPAFHVGGLQLEDLAHQAANDAVASLLGRLDTFRGESRFTSWAYRFVALEVSNKLSRHYSRRSPASLDVEGWKRLPARFGAEPLALTQQRELTTAVQWAMREALTDHQRQFLIAIVVNGAPIDAMVSQSGSNRGAIYRTVLEARRKIRAYLAANGYLGREPATRCNDQPRGHLTAIPER